LEQWAVGRRKAAVGSLQTAAIGAGLCPLPTANCKLI